MYSADFAASSGETPWITGGLMLQSMFTRSPSSEAAKKVGVVCCLWNNIFDKPISPEPSCLKREIYKKGFQFISGFFFSASLVAFLESQMLTVPSSEQVKKCVCFPSTEMFLLSTVKLFGTNLMSATYILCESIMELVCRFLTLTTCYYVLSISSSGIFKDVAFVEPSVTRDS